jgi:hypothetical protein
LLLSAKPPFSTFQHHQLSANGVVWFQHHKSRFYLFFPLISSHSRLFL